MNMEISAIVVGVTLIFAGLIGAVLAVRDEYDIFYGFAIGVAIGIACCSVVVAFVAMMINGGWIL